MILVGYCQCGCGQRTKIIDQNDRSQGLIKGVPRRFIHGHHRRQIWAPATSGPNVLGLCQCGCGASTQRATRHGDGYQRGQYRRYVPGHTRKGKIDHEGRRLRQRMYENTRRARKLGQFIEDVDPQVVYAMHGGMCGICKEFINDEFHVDHVIPLSKGGMHGYINVQPAHPGCNSRKGGRLW